MNMKQQPPSYTPKIVYITRTKYFSRIIGYWGLLTKLWSNLQYIDWNGKQSCCILRKYYFVGGHQSRGWSQTQTEIIFKQGRSVRRKNVFLQRAYIICYTSTGSGFLSCVGSRLLFCWQFLVELLGKLMGNRYGRS